MPIGKLEPFDLNSQKWPAYVRRVKQYIVLNEIKNELRVPLLITIVGQDTYSLMCDLCSPAHPESKTFDELVNLVAQHLEPQRSEIAERHVFRLRRQRVGETLTDYLQNLKHLATTCNFEANLEENLRDQFVSGLANEAMRSRIFAEKDIKYKEAVELALALEAAERHAEVSGALSVGVQEASGATSSGAEEGLHQARTRRGGSGRGGSGRGAQAGAGSAACWRCGKAHPPDRCRYANYNCDVCNKRGHLKVMCKQVRYGNQPFGRQNFVCEPEEISDDEDIFNIELMAKGTKPFFIKVHIDGYPVECEIDTGSRISAISESFYKQHFIHKPITSQNILLRSYAGSPIESLGSIAVNVTLGKVTKKNLALHVIKNGSRPLLGREWIRALSIKQISFFHEIHEDSIVTRLAAEFPEVFTDKLGTCKKTIKLELRDREPVYFRARPVPLALRARVRAELERLEAEGTIYRVEHAEFGTPIVPVVKENGDIRICGDYKVTINPKLKREYYPLPRIEELFSTLSGGEEFSKIDLTHAYAQTILTEDSQPYTAINTHLGTFVYRRTP
ncbi:uncharacterized protein K02A2.6 [Amyelois transitella]|uniref:uncharacterized protein K02A2.6 n=1 Tax=Amyelois transitella TaxID=680683 RepID=UPI00298FACB4|nr:uncharacterized protein K02A2.6 [Amyelois transitella]